MNKYILGFAIAILAATSANAQDCSNAVQPTKTWNQQPPDAPGTAPNCNGTYQQSFTVYSTTVDTCQNMNTGVLYLQAVRQVTGFGYWSAPTSGAPFCSNSTTLKCNPTIAQELTYATSGTDYNRFYLRAWDAAPMIQGAMVCPNPQNYPMARQDFWQCRGVACRNCGDCYVSVCCTTPVLIDVGGKGFALTDAANGVTFDIAGSGTPVRLGWTAPGANNAFLALPGVDGLVHNGTQLFGSYTPQPPSATPNGFAALAVYDDPKNGGNGDGVMDSSDTVFASLRLWLDANHDGVAQPEELHTLPSLGVNSISLKYKQDDRTDKYGNVFRYRAQVNPGDTTSTGRMAYDVFLIGTTTPTARNKLMVPAGGKCQVPTIKTGMLAPVSSSLR